MLNSLRKNTKTITPAARPFITNIR